MKIFQTDLIAKVKMYLWSCRVKNTGNKISTIRKILIQTLILLCQILVGCD